MCDFLEQNQCVEGDRLELFACARVLTNFDLEFFWEILFLLTTYTHGTSGCVNQTE